MYEMSPRTMSPRYLRSGQVLLDDRGMPFAVVSSRPVIASDGTVTVQTRDYPDGPFDVRKFSGRPEHRPTHGRVFVESWPTYASAAARRDRLNRMRSRVDAVTWSEYASVHHADALSFVYLDSLEPACDVEFPPGADVTVAWMGPHPPALEFGERTDHEEYRTRSVEGGYPGDYVRRYTRKINGQAYDFVRVAWGDGSVTVRVFVGNTTEVAHEWTSCGVLAQS